MLVGLQAYALYGVQGADVPSFWQVDKLGHAGMFAVPALVAVRLGGPVPFAVLVLHALCSEPLQAWLTTSRELDPWDTVADLVGIVLGVLVAQAWRSRSRKRPAELSRRGGP